MVKLAGILAVLVLGAVAVPGEIENNDEAALLSGIRQMTFEGRRAGEGYFGPDGESFIFQSEREPGNPFFQIYMMDLETGDIRRLSPGYGKTTCSWIHPDRKRALFASTHLDPGARDKQAEELEMRERGEERRYSWDYDRHFDIFEVDFETGDTRRLTDAVGYDAEGSYSPDGRWIAFSSIRRAYGRELTAAEQEKFELDKAYFADIFIIRADGTGLRQLTDTPGYDGGPFFSPDGKRITWRRFSEDGATAEIFSMKVDGTDQRQLTSIGAMSWAPFYHPTGDYLIFATNKHGFSNFELYMVDAQGRRDPARVTFTEGFDGLPTFSPDGRKLAWTSNRTAGGQSQIFFADWNDEAARETLQLGAGVVTDSDIRSDDLRAHIEYLASPSLEGRMTGSEGERLATRYAADIFSHLGLNPAGDTGSYFQQFEFTSGIQLGEGNRLAIGDTSFDLDQDWRPLAFSGAGNFDPASVVFGGYGIVAPAREGVEEYDSYTHLDVTDKWVLAFRFLPEDVTAERRQELAPYAHLRNKALNARMRGARGLLIVSGPSSQVRSQLVPLAGDGEGAGSLPVLSISDAVAQQLLDGSSRNLAELQKSLDDGSLQMGFELENRTLSADVDVVKERSLGRNVIARMASDHPDRPVVVIGAHIDHLGRGAGHGSLAGADEKDQVHFGADDNASGTAAVLEIAEWMAGLRDEGRLQLERDVIFALWSGEELGLIGSAHYAETADRDGDKTLETEVSSYLNLDMVGRLRERVILQGLGSSSVWPGEIERRNVVIGLNIATQNDSYLPTDATSFYMRKVPILAAFTDLHSEYHTPRDRAELINFDGTRQVARLMGLIGRSLATSADEPDYIEMEKPREGGRGGMRAFLGTIPDYAQGDIKGVLLGGVIGGGPAEKAGLLGGDVIVELAGQKLENLYDYTYAIEALKIGEEVTVVVMRDGERLEFKVTPESRN